jgi:hypothetical protein
MKREKACKIKREEKKGQYKKEVKEREKGREKEGKGV